MKTHTKNVVADKIERPIVTILNDIVIKTTNICLILSDRVLRFSDHQHI